MQYIVIVTLSSGLRVAIRIVCSINEMPVDFTFTLLWRLLSTPNRCIVH